MVTLSRFVVLSVSLTRKVSLLQYPGGMWRGDTMLMAYSEGKENISVTSFKLAALQGGG